jgi:DNA-binding CsgD family transcriptional regulator
VVWVTLSDPNHFEHPEPGRPWSEPWTWLSPTAGSSCSCCTRRRACWNATPGSGPLIAALIAEILSLLAGQRPAPPAGPRPPLEALSSSEIRVLRNLPTNLTAPEIAIELYVSHNTVRAHLRHLYAKLGTHRRADTVARARALGLLAPSPPRGEARLPD